MQRLQKIMKIIHINLHGLNLEISTYIATHLARHQREAVFKALVAEFPLSFNGQSSQKTLVNDQDIAWEKLCRFN